MSEFDLQNLVHSTKALMEIAITLKVICALMLFRAADQFVRSWFPKRKD